MAITRKKRRRDKDEFDVDLRSAPDPGPATSPPGRAGPDPLPTIDLDALTGASPTVDTEQRAAQYNAWAERMKAKRQRSKAVYAGVQEAEAADQPTYWSTEAVFAEAKRVADNEVPVRPNAGRIHELLEVFDLRDDASPTDVNHAYRRLAKEHHPDRYVDADEDVRRFHEERMADINQAYSALRQLERA